MPSVRMDLVGNIKYFAILKCESMLLKTVKIERGKG